MQQMARHAAYYTSFRPGQDRMVDAILAGRDALGVMPTGAGKSICYRARAHAARITFVLRAYGGTRALSRRVRPSYLNSSLTPAQQNTVLKRAREGRYQLMYVAPERLLEPRFLAFAQEAAADGGIGVPLVAIDEAHCVSQWGGISAPPTCRFVSSSIPCRSAPSWRPLPLRRLSVCARTFSRCSACKIPRRW